MGRDYLIKQIGLVSLLVIALFPLVIFFDSVVKPFYVAFIEELLGRFIPLLIVYLLYPRGTLGDRVAVGIACGMTFGLLEMFVKTYLTIGKFSPLYFIPHSFVHCVNGIVASIIIGESIENKWYILIPLAYILCSFWHCIYNTGFIGLI